MLRVLRAACLAAPLLAGAAAQAPEPLTDYRAAAISENGSTALDFELRFQGDGDGTTRLLLPDRWAETAGLHRNVSGLVVQGARVREEGPTARWLTHPPGAPITARWRVWGQAGRALGFRPDSLVVVTEAALVRPQGLENRPARFRWTGAPSGWKMISDLDHLPGGRASSLRELMDSVLIAGRELQAVTADDGLRTVMLGRFAFTPEAFAAEAGRTATAAKLFWREKRRPFLVVLVAEQGSGRRQAGAGLGDAFLLRATSDNRLQDLRRVLAHEQLHAWNPRRLGGVRAGEDQRLDAWFSEGVTDFLAYRLLLRSGAWTPQQFVEAYDQVLAAYAASPERTASNDRVRQAFWVSPAVERLPYQRGLLLATLWDARLREATGGERDLDDALRLARAEAAAAGETGRGPTAPERFVSAYRRLGGGDLGPDLARYVERGDFIRLPLDVFGSCAEVMTTGERQQVRLDPETGGSIPCARRLAGE